MQLDNIFIKTMKNLIYILIFLPTLLLSQETKNMELVGVRNITINAQENSQITFEVQEGNVLKVISATHGDDAGNMSSSSNHKYLKLNDDYIISRQHQHTSNAYSEVHDIKVNFPFYLNEGSHTLEINTHDNQEWNFTATLYTLEFKLTTP